MDNTTVTSKTLFWFTSAGKVACQRPPRDFQAVIFRPEQLIAGQAIEIGLEWNDWDWRPAFGIHLLMDSRGRIIAERFAGRDLLTARKRRPRVIADNLNAFARLFGAKYDNSLFE